METLGERIRSEREAKGIERRALAQFAGIAYSTLSDLELGASRSTTALHKIAERLGVSARWLETGNGPKKADNGTDDQARTLSEAPALIAELWIVLDLTARALAESNTDAGRSLVQAIVDLPEGLPERPCLKKMLNSLRDELGDQALVRAATRKDPKQSGRNHR